MSTAPVAQLLRQRELSTVVLALCFLLILINGSTAQNVDQRMQSKNNLRVYWVGHSLIEAVADSKAGKLNLMSLVNRFAESRNQSYSYGDHTTWGASLSALWQGKPHSYDRSLPEMKAKRIKFEADAADFDALVLTDIIPIEDAVNYEYSPYYVNKFYCSHLRRNPEARVFLYESWVNLYGSDNLGPKHLFQWTAYTRNSRKLWNKVADDAVTGEFRRPGLISSITDLFSTARSECSNSKRIYIIPVASALVALKKELESVGKQEDYVLSNGERLTIGHMFDNTYKDWPAEWPIESQERTRKSFETLTSQLTLRHPDRDLDDIHPSAIGVYFNALVSYATLFRQSPVGLLPIAELNPKTVKNLQELVWQIVSTDPATGISRLNES